MSSYKQSKDSLSPFFSAMQNPQAQMRVTANAATAKFLRPHERLLAPNYVFNCAFGRQCEVDRLTPAALLSCSARPAICMDAVNRGLLSGMQPPITADETVFTEELNYIKSQRELEASILQGGTDIYSKQPFHL